MHRWNHKKRRSNCQVWQLDEGSLLNDANVIYTFDFFHPWSYITNETGAVGKKQIQTCNLCPLLDLLPWSLLFVRQVGNGATYPGDYTCNDVFKGWVGRFLSKKKFFLFHTKWTNLATSRHQVDKMCPGEPEKVFHIDAEFFLNLLLQFPLRLQVIIFVGPINKTSTTYTWLQSLWFFSSSFFVRRSDRFQYFATSGEWSTSYQSILAAANIFAT